MQVPPKRILLMLLLPIGDTLFTTPAIHALGKRYPEAHVTAVVYPTNKGILANNSDIHRFLIWPTRENWPGIRSVLRLFWEVRWSRFDLSVEFSSYNKLITRRLGRIPVNADMQLPKLWWLLPWAGREWRKHHAVEHYSDVVRRLDIEVEDLRLRLFPSEEDEARAQSWLERHRVGPDEFLVGIHPGGEGLWGRKKWSVERFAQVADGLADAVGARIVIMGGKGDAEAAAEVASHTRAHIINAVGQTTLGETAALARHCALFVGNDSSPLHIAASQGTPVVGIYGPTDPRSYRPWIPGGREGVDYALARSNLPCAGKFPVIGGATLARWVTCLFCPSLDSITAKQVLDSALKLLAARRPH